MRQFYRCYRGAFIGLIAAILFLLPGMVSHAQPDDPITLQNAADLTELTLMGSAPLTGVQWPADDRWLATTAETLWQVTPGQTDAAPVAVNPPEPDLLATACTPAGELCATADFGGNVWLWDGGPQPLMRLTYPTPVSALAFNPDGRTLVIAADRLYLWDIATQQEIVTASITAPVTALRISPDGAWLVAALSDRTLNTWIATTLEASDPLPDTAAPVQRLLWDDDVSTLAVVMESNIDVLNFGSGQLETTIGIGQPILSADRSGDGNLIAVGTADSLQLWNLDTLNLERRFEGHSGAVNGVAFSPDNTRLLSAGEDNSLRTWDISSGDQLSLESLAAQPLVMAQLHPTEARALSLGEDGQPALWALPQGDSLPAPVTAPASIIAQAYSPDGAQLVAALATGDLLLWTLDSPDAPLLLNPDHQGERFDALAFHPDGRQIAATQGGTVFLWAVDGSGVINELATDATALRDVTYDVTGSRLAAAGDDGQIYLWALPEAADPQILSGHTAAINDLAFHPAGDWLLSAGGDQTARLWPLDSDDAPHVIEFRDPVTAVAFHPAGDLFAVGDASGQFQLSGLDDRVTYFLATAHRGSIVALDFSTDGRYLLSGGRDGTLRLWGLPDPAEGPDRDNDGIADALDACPDQSGLSPSGCPDTDEDGLTDDADWCPEIPGAVESNGCPAICGNGIVEAGESCEPPGTDTCSDLCQTIEE